MRKLRKRIVALLLSTVMVVSAIPLPAVAEEAVDLESTQSEQTPLIQGGDAAAPPDEVDAGAPGEPEATPEDEVTGAPGEAEAEPAAVAEVELAAASSGYKYILDTDGIDSGAVYAIASTDRILYHKTTDTKTNQVTGSGRGTAELTLDAGSTANPFAPETQTWLITGTEENGYTIQSCSGTNMYLNIDTGCATLPVTTTPQQLFIKPTSGGKYTISRSIEADPGGETEYFAIYNSGFKVSTTSGDLYFYKQSTDLTALTAKITEAEALTEADYTAESWAALADALADAKTKTTSSTQEEIDAARTALTNAITGLVLTPPVIPGYSQVTDPNQITADNKYLIIARTGRENSSDLYALYLRDTSGYVSNSPSTFTKETTKYGPRLAKLTVAGDSVTAASTADASSASEEVTTAVELSALQLTITPSDSGFTVYSQNSNQYLVMVNSPAAWSSTTSSNLAVTASNGEFTIKNPSESNRILHFSENGGDYALTGYGTDFWSGGSPTATSPIYIYALDTLGPVKKALEALVAECEALTQSEYTADSWNAFSEKLTAAKALLAEDATPTEEALTAAHKALTEAKDALVKSQGGFAYTATDCTVDFDGQQHSITVEVTAPENATVEYSLNENGPFAATHPECINADTYTIYFQISAEGYESVVDHKTVTINKAPAPEITVTADKSIFAAAGTVKLTVSGVPETAKDSLTVTCKNAGITVNGPDASGQYTADLPGKTALYTFEASFTNPNYQEVTPVTCTVTAMVQNELKTISGYTQITAAGSELPNGTYLFVAPYNGNYYVLYPGVTGNNRGNIRKLLIDENGNGTGLAAFDGAEETETLSAAHCAFVKRENGNYTVTGSGNVLRLINGVMGFQASGDSNIVFTRNSNQTGYTVEGDGGGSNKRYLIYYDKNHNFDQLGTLSGGGTGAGEYVLLFRLDGTDLTALETAIKKAEAVTNDGYTAASWDALQTALTQAKALTSSSAQETVDAALAKLTSSIDGLVRAIPGYTQVTSDSLSASKYYLVVSKDSEGNLYALYPAEGCTALDPGNSITPGQDTPRIAVKLTVGDTVTAAVVDSTTSVDMEKLHFTLEPGETNGQYAFLSSDNLCLSMGGTMFSEDKAYLDVAYHADGLKYTVSAGTSRYLSFHKEGDPNQHGSGNKTSFWGPNTETKFPLYLFTYDAKDAPSPREKLGAELETSKGITDGSGYTKVSWNNFTTKRTEAQAVYDNEASTENAYAVAYASLNAARLGLQALPVSETPPADAEVVRDWKTLVPKNGTTNDAPFNSGTGGSNNFRIPSIITLDSGRLLAAIDARWNHLGDACSLDTIMSYSDDNGATWNYLFPNYFGDSTDAKASYGTAFIDPVMIQGKDGTIYLMVDLFPGGVAINTAPMRPAAATGYAEIGGQKRLVLYTENDAKKQTDTNYSYYVGDFSEGYAPIYEVQPGSAAAPTAFYVDEYYYLYRQAGGTRSSEDDKLYCEQLGSSKWVQQNVFFYNACLHVRCASYLWIVKSTDGGETWSAPLMVNDQVRTGEDIFYGVGPGAGLCLTDGTVMLPVYTHITGSTERAGFIYSKNGMQWSRSDNSTITDWSSESCLVQIDENTVRHFYRDDYSTLRYTDHIRDGEAWKRSGNPVDTGVKVASGNQLSAIRYSELVDGKPAILVSTATGGSGSRTNGKIYVFLLDTSTKAIAKQYEYEVTTSGVAYAYSSLTETADGDIALLYEGAGSASVFKLIPIEDIVGENKVPKAMTYTAEGYEGAASTTPRFITVKVTDPKDGAVVTYCETKDGEYKSELPGYTTVGEHVVYYKITAEGYRTVTGSATVKLTQGATTPEITITPSATSVNGGSTVTFTVEGIPADVGTTKVTGTGPDNTAVTVSALTGKTCTAVMPNKAGAYTFTVNYTGDGTNFNDASDSCTVTVTVPLPGYTQVTSETLDTSKYYLVVSRDSDGKWFALYPTADCTSVDAGGGIFSDRAQIVAALTSDGSTLTATAPVPNGSAVELTALEFLLEQNVEGNKYSFATAAEENKKYLDVSDKMFSTTQNYLSVTTAADGAYLIRTDKGRVLDFNKLGDPKEFTGDGTYQTNFWGPTSSTPTFPIYLFTKDGAQTVTPQERLTAEITECEKIQNPDNSYTVTSWDTFTKALDAAKAVRDKANATDAERNSALAVLKAARAGLQKKPTVDTIPKSTVYQLFTGDTIESGEVYAIYTNETADNDNRILYHTAGTAKTDKVLGTTTADNRLNLSGNYAASTQLWTITEVDGGYTVQSVNSGYYLDLTTSSNKNINISATPVTLTITKASGVFNIGNGTNYVSYDAGDSGNYYAGTTAAGLRLYKQTEVPAETVSDWKALIPKSGTTEGQPFASGTGGSIKFRIPSLITLKSGKLLAAIDARWNHVGDACSLDTIISWSDDGGAKWHYSFPNYFGDSVDSKQDNATAFIDPVMIQGKDGTIYLMVDLFPGGVALNTAPMKPAASTGYEVINGKPRLVLYTSPKTSGQTDTNYAYYLGDFTKGYAPVYEVQIGKDDTLTDFYVDEYYYLYQQKGDSPSPEADKIYCQQLGSSKWVQQNVFFYNACLHVRNASYLWLVTSKDEGMTWSKPIMLNDQVRTGEDIFYGVGPGAGLCLDDGTVMLTTYTYSNQFAQFIYTSDNGKTWHRSESATSGDHWSSESCLVQIDADTVRHFYRDGYSTLYYTDHTRNENGLWTAGQPVNTGTTVTYDNQLSAIKYSELVDGKTAIMVSTATGSEQADGKTPGRKRRINGKIYTFLLDGTTNSLGNKQPDYTYDVTTDDAAYGYSSLSEMDDGNIALLYEGAGNASVFKVIPIKDIVGEGKVPKTMTYTAKGYEGAASTTLHYITVEVTDPKDGAVITYCETQDGEYQSEPLGYTEVGEHVVYYKITAEGYRTVTGSETVKLTQGATTPKITITPSDTSVTGGSTVTFTLEGIPADVGKTEVTGTGPDNNAVTVSSLPDKTWTAVIPNKVGTYTFTVNYTGDGTNFNNATASCTVTVTETAPLPGYTQVTSGTLDTSKYYLVVSQDSAGNWYALYPASGGVGLSPGGALDAGKAKIAATLTKDETGTALTAVPVYDSGTAPAAVELTKLEFTLEAGEGSTYAFVSQDGIYLALENAGMFSESRKVLNVAFHSDKNRYTISNGTSRYLAFSKNGEGEYKTYKTNFWGPNKETPEFPIYLFMNDTAQAATPRDKLTAEISACDKIEKGTYTEVSWTAFTAALEAAKKVKDNPNATDLDCNNALAVLTAAREGLQEKPTVDTIPKSTVYQLFTGDTIESGEVYAIYTNETADNDNRILYHTAGTATTDKVLGTTTADNRLNLSGNYAASTQLWTITEVDGGYTVQSVNSGYYLDLTTSSNKNINISATPVTLTITKASGVFNIGNGTNYVSYDASDNGNYYAGTTAAGLRLYKQTEVDAETVSDWTTLVPKPGTTEGQPFASGTGGSSKFRIPSLITLKNGRLLAAIDARWNHVGDACSLDTIISWSDDNGANWNYSFPNYFGDSTNNFQSYGTAFIDPVMIQGKDGTIYLMVDLFPGGVALNTAPMQPAASTGYEDINGKHRLVLYTSPETSEQTDTNYAYYLGDFENNYAPVYEVQPDGSDTLTKFYVDEYYYLYQQKGNSRSPEADKIYCQQVGSSKWVQQNVFFYNACLHVRNASYLWLVTSKDDGKTWSKPIMLNDQVRTGKDLFYGVGPGAGLCLDDGTVMLPVYTHTTGSSERASFIYSKDGVTWNRAKDATTSDWSSESCLVQINENTVRHFYRDDYSTLRYTDHTRNEDGTWTPGTPVDTGATVRYGNQLSAIRYSDTIGGKTVIMVSTAANTGARANGKIYTFLVNDDAEHTMSKAYEYEVTALNEAYAYSSLTEMASGDIALLYEGTGIVFTTIDIAKIAPGAKFDSDVSKDKILLCNAEDYTGTYDGTAHGITVAVTDAESGTAVSGAAITYSETQNGTYQATPYTYTNAGTYTVYYKVTAEGYKEASGSATVTISKAPVSLTISASPSSFTNGGGTVTLTVGGIPAGGSVTVTANGGVTPNGSGTSWTATLPDVDYNYTFTASYPGSGNYLDDTVSCEVPVKTPVTDLTALNAAISKAEGLSSDRYTSQSWAALTTALTEAKGLSQSNTQEEVNSALAKLTAAMNALELLPPTIPGYTRVTGSTLDPTRYYMVITQDSAGNIYALYPNAQGVSTSTANALELNQPKVAANVSVTGTDVSASTLSGADDLSSTGAPLDLFYNLNLRAEAGENGQYALTSAKGGLYLSLGDKMFSTEKTYLSVEQVNGVFTIRNTGAGSRMLDFNKKGDPKQYTVEGQTFETNFWGSDTAHFPIYLYCNDDIQDTGALKRLQQLFNECTALEQTDYTALTWEPFYQARLAAGRLVNTGGSDSELNDAYNALASARDALQRAPEVAAPPAGADIIKDWHTMVPASGTTNEQPFLPGTGGSSNFRVPALITLKDGSFLAVADARWNHLGDACGLDTIISRSTNGGETWSYSFLNYFGDSVNAKEANATAFIDTVMVRDNSGKIYVLGNLFPGGVALNTSPMRPAAASGYVDIGGTKRLVLYTDGRTDKQTDENYNYYIGDFAGGYAPIYEVKARSAGTKTDFYVDQYYYLYKGDGTDPESDKIYCQQLGSEKWVQQNVFFYNACLHVRNVSYLWLRTSSDNGKTWSIPKILNDQVRTGTEQFYGVGPGAGLCTSSGMVILPCYTWSGKEAQRASFIYTTDGVTWKRSDNATVGDWSGESCLVEINPTTVRQFFRDKYNTLRYTDHTWNGSTWDVTAAAMDTGAQVTSDNQISAIRYDEPISGSTAILVSTATANGTTRQDGKIYTFLLDESGNLAERYDYAVTGSGEAYGYSSLTQTGNNIALLYEGQNSAIRFQIIPITTIAPEGTLPHDITYKAQGYEGTYDGGFHSIDVTVTHPAQGAVVTYSEQSGGSYTEQKPAYKDAGEYTVYFKITDPNHEQVKTGSAVVKITRAVTELTITPSAAQLTGGGNVTLTVTGAHDEGSLLVTCDKDVVVTQGADGKWTAALPNQTETFTFTATYTGVNYTDARQTCTVEVTQKGTDPGPGPSQDPDPGPSQDPDPGPSQDPDPGPSQDPDPGPSQNPDPVYPDPDPVYPTPTPTPTTPGGSKPEKPGGNKPENPGSTPDKVETVNPDGSTTTTVTDESTGTVTETTEKTDGSTVVVETQQTGSVTTTETRPDQIIVQTVEKPDTNVTATVTIPEEISEAVVTIPASTQSTATKPDSTAMKPGVVAVDAKTGEIIKLSVPTEDGMLVKLESSAEIILEDRSMQFEDTKGHWAEDSVDFVTARDMFKGTGEDTFAPNDSMTRGMLMTVLARFDGEDTSGGEVWYEKGMDWAVSKNISDGKSPNEDITREQLATMLYRYAGSPVVRGSLARFGDADQVSAYAADAMRWAVEKGLIVGGDGGLLLPKGKASRAQVATILARFCGELVKM